MIFALVGMPGAGKTSVGRALAATLCADFVDLDAEIVSGQGMEIAEIFKTQGEAAFREIEARQLESLYLQRGPGVMARTLLSLGGGAVMNEQSRARVKAESYAIYLRCSVDTLLDRVARDSHRPLLAGVDLRKKLTQLLASRESQYQEAADHSIDVDNMSIEQVAAHLATMLLARLPAAETRV